MNCYTKKFISGTALVIFATLMISACSKPDKAIELVKGGTLHLCPGVTVGEMVDGFMGNPSWDSGVDEKNITFVNIGGDITYDGKPVRAVVQFIVNDRDQSFEYQAFEINGIAQNNLTAASLMRMMCESTDAAQTVSDMSDSVDSESPEQSANYSRDELKEVLNNKTKDEVKALLGVPDETQELGGMKIWYYSGISYDADTGAADSMTQIAFQNERVIMVSFQ